jgi:hypothetical protein
MRRRFARFSVLALLTVPLAAMGLAVPAGASAATTCSGNKGSIKLSPGLGGSAQVQNVTIKGTLSGCTGSTVTAASYVAHLKTTDPVSCAALASAGEATSGSIVIKWSPKGQGNSNGTFGMPLTAVPGVSISGTLSSEPFASSTISGTVSQSFAGTCGSGGKGKKKGKKVKDGTFTGSAVEIA